MVSFYNGGKMTVTSVEGNDAWQTVLTANSARRTMVIFVHTGAADDTKIDFSDTLPTDETNSIEIHEGVMWEPKLTPTNALHFKAAVGDRIVVWTA